METSRSYEAIFWYQDATYITSINPNENCTVWTTLDDTDKNIGTLEYILDHNFGQSDQKS